jgi:cation/acetate symporter
MTELARRLPFMISDSAPAAQARSVAWLTAFVALLAILAFVVETLSQLGVPAKILVWLVAGFALAVPAGIAIAVRTISPGEFALAGRNVALGVNAAVSAIAAFGGVFSIAIAAAFFRGEGQMSALALGLCGGLVVGGILLAPYFRRSGSQTVGDFLAARFGSRLVSALAGLIVAVALFPMLVAQLTIAATIAGWTLGIGRQAALVTAALLMLLPPLLGGMRGVTATALVQFVLALVAFVVVGIWISAEVTGWSLPIVGYASALTPVPSIEATANASAAIWNDAGVMLSIALGVACFPALLIRSATARSSASARLSIAWALLLVAVFAICAATLAAVAKLALDATARQAGSAASLVDAAPWIAEWANKDAGLVTLCGQSAADPVAALAACGTKVLASGDLAVSPDIVMLAAPAIAGLPQLATMLLAAGCLVAALAAASLVLFTIGAALGHDLYFRSVEPRATMSRRLLAQRLSLLIATGLAAYVAAAPPADYLQLALWSLALAASGLFPAMVLAVWWKRANRWGAIAGMISGFAVTACVIATNAFYPQLFGYLEQAKVADFVRGVGSKGIVAAAVPAGFVVAILISLVTRRPGPAQRQFAEALARPRDFPVDG